MRRVSRARSSYWRMIRRPPAPMQDEARRAIRLLVNLIHRIEDLRFILSTPEFFDNFPHVTGRK
ncbi:hypothetical protein AX760_16215 [Pararhizobium antarcticum]|uniref:Uncharacterized protein n=1 Tax=Pararhizobium antarcticum TaxID=1798805 RepID=A0A657LUD1_9HYPH|nr:hypothetical protein AX760_16215 [Pararhizobium antarcticum]OJF99903.1 hypothetical protein AX761_10165 [Rhizobium sp. 58]